MERLPLELQNEIAEYLAFDDIANLGLAFRHAYEIIQKLLRMRLENMMLSHVQLQNSIPHHSNRTRIRLETELVRHEFYLTLLYCAGMERLFKRNIVSIWDESLFADLPISLFCAWHDARYHTYSSYSDLKCSSSREDCKCGRCYASIGLVILGDMKLVKCCKGWPVICKDYQSSNYRYIETIYEPVISMRSLNDYCKDFGAGQYILIEDTRNVNSLPMLELATVSIYRATVPHMSDDNDDYINSLINGIW